jgi:2-polyprenyl-6-hydroxyphenyl methylase/3-demethylubiquinone-9 3-methyltransferase
MDTPATARCGVNNEVYAQLGERWYLAKDDPVALLRAQARARNPWVREQLSRSFGEGRPSRVLDVGCGAGLLANDLARAGHQVIGLDASHEALAVAAHHDVTGRVRWHTGDASALAFPAADFNAVCAMDFLEHVEEPERVVIEVARVLLPGELFFFHTFNRNWLSWLVVIKGVEWFVRNTPKDLHLLRLFIRPAELDGMCARHGLSMQELRGFNPKPWSRPFFRMLTTREVSDDLEFEFSRSTRVGYTGVARKIS